MLRRRWAAAASKSRVPRCGSAKLWARVTCCPGLRIGGARLWRAVRARHEMCGRGSGRWKRPAVGEWLVSLRQVGLLRALVAGWVVGGHLLAAIACPTLCTLGLRASRAGVWRRVGAAAPTSAMASLGARRRRSAIFWRHVVETQWCGWSTRSSSHDHIATRYSQRAVRCSK